MAYLHAARDFVGHADVLLQSLVESLRQSVVVGYVVAVAGGPLSPRWTRQQSVVAGYVIAVAGGPLSPRWTQQLALSGSFYLVHDVSLVVLPFPPLFRRRGVPLPVPYHAVGVEKGEPLSAQESHGHDVLFPDLFDDEGHPL